MRRIGIVGRRTDEHVRELSSAIAGLGAEPVVIDLRGFPRWHRVSLGDCARFDDIGAPQPIELDQLAVVHLRGVDFASLSPDDARGSKAEAIAAHHRRELARLAFQESLARRLARRMPVINPPSAFRFHRLKAFQHQLLVQHGLDTPRAISTADAAAADAFVTELAGEAVVKPGAGGAEVIQADRAFSTLRSRRRPYLYQRRVDGRSLRAYLLDGRVVSLGELHHDRRAVDWRQRVDDITLLEPEPELSATLKRAAELLGLRWCSIDLEWDATDRRMWLLDLNPSPMFRGWSRRTGVDLARLLAEHLVEVAERSAGSL